jgi:hypothetical protein
LSRASVTGASSGDAPNSAALSRAFSGSPSGITLAVTAQASLPGTSSTAATSTVEARALASQAAPSATLANGLQAGSFATALPQSSDLAAAEAGNANVASRIGTAGNVFALLTLSGGYSDNGSGAPGVYQSTVSIRMNVTALVGQPVRIGLLDPFATGLGFDSLTLSITNGTDLLRSDTFADLNSAEAFFSDDVLDLPALPTPNGTDGNLVISLTVNASRIGDGFGADVVAAAVPEPSVIALLLPMVSTAAGIRLVRRLGLRHCL